MNSAFDEAWARFHPRQVPLGYMLREGEAERWVRFHSLPDSKRYAELPEERSILIDRQNTLAAAVLGEGSRCWLVQCHWSVADGIFDMSIPTKPASTASWDDFAVVLGIYDPFVATKRCQLPPTAKFDLGDEEVPESWQPYARLVDWTRGGLDWLLWSIAMDRAAPTLWMSKSNGAIFAPYDGGVDVILPEGGQVEPLKRRFGPWLSVHPSGL